MSQKTQPRPFFSELQSNLAQHVDANLTELNRKAIRELQRLGHPGLSNGVYNESGDLLGVLSIRMLSALRIREDLYVAGREQKPDVSTLFLVPNARPVSRKSSRDPTAINLPRGQLPHRISMKSRHSSR